MSKTATATEGATIFWQEWSEGSPGEPAILIQSYSDCITLVQEGREILISRHQLKEFIRELNNILKQ